MKTYQAEFDENNIGVFAISLVENPAMEGNFVALSKQDKKIEFKTVDKEQRILMGLVLEPNKPIYRNEGGEEFNIVFSEHVIKDLSHNFFKQGNQSNSTIEHSEEPIRGVTFVESWIVEDSKVDKSANFGFSYPKGSWVATMKVDSDEIWNEYVKSGKVLGFSIDAFLKLKEVKLKSNIEMSEIKSGFAQLKEDLLVALKIKEKAVEVEFGAIKSEDGAVTIQFDGEAIAVGGSVWVDGEDGERIPLPVGEIPLEDGKVLVIVEEGVASEVREAAAEQPKEELSDETATPTPTATAKEVTEAIKSVLIKYSEEVDVKFAEFETKLAEIVKENESLNAQVVELSKEPAKKPIKSVPEQSGRKLTLTERINNKLQ